MKKITILNSQSFLQREIGVYNPNTIPPDLTNVMDAKQNRNEGDKPNEGSPMRGNDFLEDS